MVGNQRIFPYCHSHAPVIPYPGCIEISQLLCHSCPYPIYPSLLHLITVLSNFIHLLGMKLLLKSDYDYIHTIYHVYSIWWVKLAKSQLWGSGTFWAVP